MTEFNLMGVDASTVNAFRRIVIAEIPSVATEPILLTRLIRDEALAHRTSIIADLCERAL
ncbi:hypothetical protein PM082_018073 [Marasmius tenuissimus]|nr:hypothetical protein PM082_018073 [Marasmius tenuissimus]